MQARSISLGMRSISNHVPAMLFHGSPHSMSPRTCSTQRALESAIQLAMHHARVWHSAWSNKRVSTHEAKMSTRCVLSGTGSLARLRNHARKKISEKRMSSIAKWRRNIYIGVSSYFHFNLHRSSIDNTTRCMCSCHWYSPLVPISTRNLAKVFKSLLKFISSY